VFLGEVLSSSEPVSAAAVCHKTRTDRWPPAKVPLNAAKIGTHGIVAGFTAHLSRYRYCYIAG
jgi:hypothetical protein